jgi:hypothetical protein
MSDFAEPASEPSSAVRKAPPRIVKNQGLPMRWIVFSVIIAHLGVLIIFGSQSEKILRKQEPVEPQNFYHAEEVYEVNAGQGEELVRVREYTVSTELYPRDELPPKAPETRETPLPIEQVEPKSEREHEPGSGSAPSAVPVHEAE